VLTDDQAGLNGLPEANLIGQKVTLNWICQHSPDGRDLMRHELDTGGDE
jgi:hypothetical protein